jgi:thiol-disulfide isomerase/thioredoxin
MGTTGENPKGNSRTRVAAKIILLVLLVWGFIYFLNFASNSVMSLKSVPDFKVMGLQGQTITKNDIIGRNYVINFWATWCSACMMEMDLLKSMKDELARDGIDFLAIASDENPKKVGRFVKEAGIHFPVAVDYYGTAIDSFGVKYLPVTLFVNKAGEVKKVVPGVLNDRELRAGLAFLK